MLIIAFAPKTSKILPKILCRHFKHCAVIVRDQDEFIMYQFIARKKIEQIKLKTRDVSLLGQQGWKFVYLPCSVKHNFDPKRAWNCVDMSKRALGIKSYAIQTPWALYKFLNA